METNPIAVVRNNVLGTLALAQAAAHFGVRKLLMISTDKAANPRSVMGAAKRVAEMLLLRLSSAQTQMSAIRLGNVLESHGSVIPLFRRQIARGGPVTVTHPDACRYFLSMADAVDFILTAATLPGISAVLVPELDEPLKILDLARQLIRDNAAAPSSIEIVFTALRPGDKLGEELISTGERLEPIVGSSLRRMVSPAISSPALDSALHALSEAAHSRNLPVLIDILCTLVPDYVPSDAVLHLLGSPLALSAPASGAP